MVERYDLIVGGHDRTSLGDAINRVLVLGGLFGHGVGRIIGRGGIIGRDKSRPYDSG